MLADVAASAVRLVRVGCAMIERCAGYWVPTGTIPRTLCQQMLPAVYDLLGASKLTTSEARALGFPVRRLEEGQRRGYHWRLPADAPERAAQLLEELAREGIEAPTNLSGRALGDEQRLRAVRRGRRVWVVCPEHRDTDPSALVNPSGAVYCFACARVIGHGRLAGAEVVYRRFEGELVRPKVPSTRPILPAPEASLPPVHEVPTGGSYSGSPGSSSNAHNDDPSGDDAEPVIPLAQVAPAGPYSVRAVTVAGMPGANPTWRAKDAPVGVLVPAETPEDQDFVRSPMALGYVLARRFGDEGLMRRSRRGMQRAYSSKRDLLDVLRAAQRRDAGPSSQRRAWEGSAKYEQSWVRDHRAFLPDHYVSLDLHTHEATRAMPVKGSKKDSYVLVPEGFSARCGRWIGIDLDGFDIGPVGDKGLAEAAQRIAAALEQHPAFTGRMGVLRTSTRGVQIVAELTHTRWDLDAFYADPSVQRMLSGLDDLCLREVRAAGFVGGHADPTVHASGRLVRRPGPRLTKDGDPYVAHLVWATP